MINLFTNEYLRLIALVLLHCVHANTRAFDHLTRKAAVTDVFSILDSFSLLAGALSHVKSTRKLHRNVLHFLCHDLSVSNVYAGINFPDNRKCDLL